MFEGAFVNLFKDKRSKTTETWKTKTEIHYITDTFLIYHFVVGGFVLNVQGITVCNMFSCNFLLEYFKTV